MTGKEIFLEALKFKPTPRLPMGILDGYAWILNRTGKSFADLFADTDGAKIAAEQYRALRTDIAYMNGHVFNVVHRVMDGEIQLTKVGEAVDITRHPLTEINDHLKFNAAEVMAKAFAEPEYVSTFAQSRELAKMLGGEKLISAIAYAPFTVAAMLTGVQDFMAAMYDDDDETLALVDFAADLVIASAEKFVECGAEAVFVADPVASGDLISAAVYEKFALPALKKICAAFAGRVPVLCHICGQTENRLQPLRGSGVSGFSMDAVDLKTALDSARGHFAILGNLSPFDVVLSKTPDEITAICADRIKVAGNNGGFILFPGCDLPPKAPLENVIAMADAAEKAFV